MHSDLVLLPHVVLALYGLPWQPSFIHIWQCCCASMNDLPVIYEKQTCKQSNYTTIPSTMLLDVSLTTQCTSVNLYQQCITPKDSSTCTLFATCGTQVPTVILCWTIQGSQMCHQVIILVNMNWQVIELIALHQLH